MLYYDVTTRVLQKLRRSQNESDGLKYFDLYPETGEKYQEILPSHNENFIFVKYQKGIDIYNMNLIKVLGISIKTNYIFG